MDETSNNHPTNSLKKQEGDGKSGRSMQKSKRKPSKTAKHSTPDVAALNSRVESLVGHGTAVINLTKLQ